MFVEIRRDVVSRTKKETGHVTRGVAVRRHLGVRHVRSLRRINQRVVHHARRGEPKEFRLRRMFPSFRVKLFSRRRDRRRQRSHVARVRLHGAHMQRVPQRRAQNHNLPRSRRVPRVRVEDVAQRRRDVAREGRPAERRDAAVDERVRPVAVFLLTAQRVRVGVARGEPKHRRVDVPRDGVPDDQHAPSRERVGRARLRASAAPRRRRVEGPKRTRLSVVASRRGREPGSLDARRRVSRPGALAQTDAEARRARARAVEASGRRRARDGRHQRGEREGHPDERGDSRSAERACGFAYARHLRHPGRSRRRRALCAGGGSAVGQCARSAA